MPIDLEKRKRSLGGGQTAQFGLWVVDNSRRRVENRPFFKISIKEMLIENGYFRPSAGIVKFLMENLSDKFFRFFFFGTRDI